MFYVFVALCLFSSALLEIKGKPCKQLKGVKELDLAQFVGDWYRAQQHPLKIDNSTCPMLHFTRGESDNTIVYHHTNGQQFLLIRDKLNPSTLDYTMDSNNDGKVTILAIDYESYAITYGCHNDSEHRVDILTRKYEPLDDDQMKTIDEVLEKTLGPINMVPTNLSGCGKVQLHK